MNFAKILGTLISGWLAHLLIWFASNAKVIVGEESETITFDYDKLMKEDLTLNHEVKLQLTKMLTPRGGKM